MGERGDLRRLERAAMSKHPSQEPPRTTENNARQTTAADIARYIADMTLQMQTMAQAAQLDLLAYLLGLTHEEADGIGRGK
jgi:hypothetical protein